MWVLYLVSYIVICFLITSLQIDWDILSWQLSDLLLAHENVIQTWEFPLVAISQTGRWIPVFADFWEISVLAGPNDLLKYMLTPQAVLVTTPEIKGYL